MNCYDRFMMDDSDKGISKLKLNGILVVDGYTLHNVSKYDIRLKSNSGMYNANPIYVSILHSKYTYEYIQSREWEIIQMYTTSGYLTIHKDFILNDFKISNTMISYRDSNLIEQLIKNNIL